MKQPERERDFLLHIAEALDCVTEYTADGRSAFDASRMIRDAVMRNLEIVGEATKRLSEQTRQLESGIPWRRIAGLRDVLIHDYFGVDADAVWGVVETNVPELRAAVERMLGEI